MGRLLAVLLWLLALGSIAAMGAAVHQLTDSPRRASGSDRSPPSTTVARVPASRPLAVQSGWRVVDHLSAEHVSVIHVETDRIREARQIAVALVEPIKQDYTEMLVYFHRPGRRHLLPARRVQWSPLGGYTETVYEQPVSRPQGLAASAADTDPSPAGSHPPD